MPKLQESQRYASVKWWPHGSRFPVVAAQPSGLIWELSLQSQLSCAILIHNFLLHVARRQITQSLSTRLKGGKRWRRITEEGRELGMPYLQSSFIPPLQRIQIARRPSIQPGIEQEGCDRLGKGHPHLTLEFAPGEVGGHTSIFLKLS